MRSPKYLRPASVAKRFGLSVGTLASWRFRQIGPPYIKAGKTVLYRVTELQAWLDSHSVRPGSGDDQPQDTTALQPAAVGPMPSDEEWGQAA